MIINTQNEQANKESSLEAMLRFFHFFDRIFQSFVPFYITVSCKGRLIELNFLIRLLLIAYIFTLSLKKFKLFSQLYHLHKINYCLYFLYLFYSIFIL